MKSFSLLSLLSLFPILLSGQVPIQGELRLNDTSQIHILTTQRGDQFKGNLIAFQNDSVFFLLKTLDRLAFPFSGVKLIEVVSDAEPPMPPFLLRKKDGRSLAGYVRAMTGGKIYFVVNGRMSPIDLDEVASIEFRQDDQDTTFVNRYELRIYKGSSMQGSVVRYDGTHLIFQLENDTLLPCLPAAIQSLRLLWKLSEPIPTGPVPPRGHENMLIVSHTGFNFKKHEGEIRSTLGLVNNVQYGLTDHFSIGGGTLFIIPYLTGKYSIGTRNLHASLGGMVITTGKDVVVGGNANLSVGNENAFLNASFSRFKSTEEHAEAFNIFSLGGSMRTGEKSRIFSEVVFFREDDYRNHSYNANAYTIGASYFNRRHKWDFGFMLSGPLSPPFCDEDYCWEEAYQEEHKWYLPLPVISYSYKFERGK